MQVCRYPQVCRAPSLGVKTVRDFVRLAKSAGERLNYGSAARVFQSIGHETVQQTAGIETVPIHYRGGGRRCRTCLRPGFR